MTYLTQKFPFSTKAKPSSITVTFIKKKSYKSWLKKQKAPLVARIKAADFAPDKMSTLPVYTDKSALTAFYQILPDEPGLYESSKTVSELKKLLSKETLKKSSFKISGEGLTQKDLNNLCIGWALGCYSFDKLKEKTDETPPPVLIWPDKADQKRVQANLSAITLLRDLINLPTNHLGPAQLEKAAKELATMHKAEFASIVDKDLIKQNFPLIYTVGEAAASDRRPRLIEINWGKKTHPKLTLVGKGVCFDTGGLDLKPSQYMRLMKKDMGGAAHVLALAHMIMALNLPVRLKVLIPAVENAVSGSAFRPGDVIKSRKGLFVENTNTDAEGRLILADSLAYACEDTPDLLIDYATLTGSARAALGQEIPALFGTYEKTKDTIRKLSFKEEDPLWPMPLYEDYNRHLKSTTGDIVNSAGLPGDLIYSALFLNKFIASETEWLHIDTFAWESTGRPGRPAGGTDCGLRAMFAYLEQRYG